jgi:hypothetical protein
VLDVSARLAKAKRWHGMRPNLQIENNALLFKCTGKCHSLARNVDNDPSRREFTMNRTVLLGAVLVVLAALGYYQFSHLPSQRAAEEAAAAATAAAETEAATAAKAAEDAAKAAADAATGAATEAAGAVAGAVESATEAATEAASEAAGAVTEAVGAATEAATAAATEAAGAVSGAAAAVGDAASMVWDATKLTGEEVLARIEAAPIADSVKQTLIASYNSVKDNSAGVQMVLDQLKQAMGL